METFKTWFEEVQLDGHMKEARAMALATLSPEGHLHNRIVLLKEITDEGLVFYTNYESSKGKDLKAHPTCEVVFYWDHIGKQVRISGKVEKTSREVSEAYWNTRPKESQFSQYISKQSEPIKDRLSLEERVEQVRNKFKDEPVPLPSHWGGYLIRPNKVELWIGHPSRLHDRYLFTKKGGSWTSGRLYP